MSDPRNTISEFTLPDNTVVDLEDTQARTDIENLKKAKQWIGVTTTPLTDGSTTNPITINGIAVTAVNGDVAGYNNDEFVFSGTVWQKSDLSFLGTLAYKNSVSASYIPQGSVSTPTITVTPHTATIKNPTSKNVVNDITTANPSSTAISGALVYMSYDATTKNLTFKNIVPSVGSSITTSDTTVVDGITSATASQPSFTGTGATIVSS